MHHEQHPYSQWPDLAGRALGGQVLDCSDDFFAEMENLIKPEKPVFIAGKYTERGKWMDGWESRCKREPGYDWAVLRLGAPGVIRGFNVCTRFFAGNAPQQISIEGCSIAGMPDAETQWTTIIEQQDVKPDRDNYMDCPDSRNWTHLRLNIFPDGGVARLRVYGQARLNRDWLLPGEPVDLAAIVNGARPLECSDMFFSSMTNLLMPGRGKDMGDGWETKRRRGGRECDWIIIRLATSGTIHKVLVDTAHFKGNYPKSFRLLALNSATDDVTENDERWEEIIDHQFLTADNEHYYRKEVQNAGQFYTHVKLAMYPDGGISRLRVYGFPVGGDASVVDSSHG